MHGNGKKTTDKLKHLLVILLGSFAVGGFAQPDTATIIDYRAAFVKRKPGIMRMYTGIVGPTKNSAEKFDRFNTDFFWNSWLGNTNNVETDFYALGHNINLMFDIPFGPKSRMGIAIGLGYSHFCVRHNGALYFYSDSLGTGMYTMLQQYAGPKRWINRTVFNLVEIPFELRFRSLRERGKIKFYPGFKAGFIVENYHKWRIEHSEFKELNFPDLNRIHYGPTLRLGVDNVMLFGYYDLAYLFTHQNSSKLQLFSVGISIGWF
jgi:hypothetical protein